MKWGSPGFDGWAGGAQAPILRHSGADGATAAGARCDGEALDDAPPLCNWWHGRPVSTIHCEVAGFSIGVGIAVDIPL
jgi:hypothetical protein